MKLWVLLLLIFSTFFSYGQKKNTSNFPAIDWQVQFIEAPNTDSLVKLLTPSHFTELEKVRSIFSWVATKISYNVGIYNRYRTVTPKFAVDYSDTMAVWKSADEMVADKIFHRRVAVCDGYARLFKTLCEYAGIKSELILGYVNTEPGKVGDRFKTNHTWNAVYIDSSWHLVDVTWGSGYINFTNQFVHNLDDYYFFTPPEKLIRDHFPEDPKWTLLPDPPVLQEFKKSPLKCKAFVKYGIASFTPASGIIDAFVGDTVRIELKLWDVKKAKNIASSSYDNSLPETMPGYALIEPSLEKGESVFYTFKVESITTSWLQLVYNKDVILQYKLNVKERQELSN